MTILIFVQIFDDFLFFALFQTIFINSLKIALMIQTFDVTIETFLAADAKEIRQTVFERYLSDVLFVYSKILSHVFYLCAEIAMTSFVFF